VESSTSGPAVVVSVRTFIERFDEMAASVGSYGPEGAAATALLATRGLTRAVIDEARELLETVGRIETYPDVTTVDQDQEDLAKAEASLWAWYLEWSQIARIAVTQRSLLKQMGFVQSQSKADVVADPTANGVAPHAPIPPTTNPIIRSTEDCLGKATARAAPRCHRRAARFLSTA